MEDGRERTVGTILTTRKGCNMQRNKKAYVLFEYRNRVGLFVSYDKKTNEEMLDDTDFDRLCNMLSDYGYNDVEFISLKPTLVTKP